MDETASAGVAPSLPGLEPAADSTPLSTFLSKVELQNYKSIRACDVRLRPLTFLVGRNGAGKSNFIDGLRFVHDALDTNLATAMAAHGAPGSMRRVGTRFVAFKLTFALGGQTAAYSLRLDVPDNTFEVTDEKVSFVASGEETRERSLIANGGQQRTLGLALVAAESVEYRAVYDFIRSMRFYDFSMPSIRALQDPSPGELLRADGSNLASVLRRLIETDRRRYERLNEYMRAILPGLTEVTVEDLGPKEGLRFGCGPAGKFWAQHMSTGTLHALAVLAALFQPPDSNGQEAQLLALEEPERALHPAAVGVLFDAIVEASADRQVLIATQSPELLDRKDVPADDVRAVLWSNDGSRISGVNDSAREVLQSHLFTAGELIRLDQLDPDTST